MAKLGKTLSAFVGLTKIASVVLVFIIIIITRFYQLYHLPRCSLGKNKLATIVIALHDRQRKSNLVIGTHSACMECESCLRYSAIGARIRRYDRVLRERDYAAYHSRRETFFHLREKSARDFVSISTRLVKLLRDVLSLFSVRNSVTRECEGKLLRSNSTNLYPRWT